MRNYFLWNSCVDREYISAYDKDWIPLFLVHVQVCPPFIFHITLIIERADTPHALGFSAMYPP
jgi:hypothetical protein